MAARRPHRRCGQRRARLASGGRRSKVPFSCALTEPSRWTHFVARNPSDCRSSSTAPPTANSSRCRSAPRRGHARALAREAIDEAARRLGASRRGYLQSLLGAAATLAAFNRAFAAAGQRGGHYVLPAEAAFEPAAAQVALGGDEFIFDVQLHHVNPQGAWRQERRPERVSRHAQQQLRQGRPRRVLLQRRTAEGRVLRQRHRDGRAVACAGWHGDQPARLRCRRAPRAAAANALDGTERLLLHGRCMPTLPGEIDGMDAQIAQFPVAAFKTYTQFGPRDGAAGFYPRRRPLRHAVHRARAQARRAPHRGAQGPAVRPARLRVLERARHRASGQAPSRT